MVTGRLYVSDGGYLFLSLNLPRLEQWVVEVEVEVVQRQQEEVAYLQPNSLSLFVYLET
jgi:hypothetical protein